MVEALVAESDWSAIQSAVLYRPDHEHRTIIVNPIVSPVISFDWIVVEPPRRGMSNIAQLFLERLREDLAARLETWAEVFAAIEGSASA